MEHIAYIWSICHSVQPAYGMMTFGTTNLKHGMNLGLSLIPCPINFVEADRTNVFQHPSILRVSISQRDVICSLIVKQTRIDCIPDRRHNLVCSHL